MSQPTPTPPVRPPQVTSGTGRTNSPPFDALRFRAWGTLMVELIIAQVAMALGNIDVLGTHPLAFLTQWGQDLEQKASTAYATAETAQTTADTSLGNWTALLTALGVPNVPALASFLTNAGTDFVALMKSFIPGYSGADLTQAKLDFANLGKNLLAMLGGPNLVPSGTFDPVAAAGQALGSVWTPAGALTNFTPIPPHLFAYLNTATASVNVLPDGGFDDPNGVVGLGVFAWSAAGRTKPGSMWTTANGSLRQAVGVAIPAVPGDAIYVSGYAKWTGVVASAGNAITVAVNAYAVDDAGNETLIPDPTHRVLATITAPGAASSAYPGHDPDGWVALAATGKYQVPAGAGRVRMVLEVGANVTAGNVGFDDCVMNVSTGLIDASLLKNLENIGTLDPTTMAGINGIIDMVNTFDHMIDGLGTAYNPTGTVSGLTFADLFSLAQQGTTNTQTALFQSAIATLVLGQRANKSAANGANPTSQTSFDIGHFSSGGSVVTSALTTGQAIAQRYVVPESATYGFVEILAAGSSMTNVFLNIYKINPVTNAKVALFNSANIATLIPASLNHVRVLLPGMPESLPGDILLLEVVNASTPSLTLATKATGAPNNANEVVQNVGFSRSTSAGGNSPTSLTSGQGSYTGTIPYAIIGITNVPADYHPPEKSDYTVAGTYHYTSPAWLSAGDIMDGVAIGAGGGGGGSLYYVSGQGGEAAVWGGGSLIYDTDIKLGSVVTVVVGNRGPGGAAGNGGNGGDTSISWIDPSGGTHTVVFPGGDYGGLGGLVNSSNSNGANITGQGASNFVWNDVTYFGGGIVNVNQTGQSPGGGGGGAPAYGNGCPGGVGEAHLVFRQA